MRILAPKEGEPKGWYEEFVSRWRAYLEVLAQPPGARPMTLVTQEQEARVRPDGCCAVVVGAEVAVGSSRARERDGAGDPHGKRRKKEASPPVAAVCREKRRREVAGDRPKRQRGLAGWLVPRLAGTVDAQVPEARDEDEGEHGRAESPLT